MLACTSRRTPASVTGSRMAPTSRATSAIAAERTSSAGPPGEASTANSSPPRRATSTSGPAAADSRRATSVMSRSPTWCPRVSLISLKWSRSASTTTTPLPVRCASSTARVSSRCSRARLGSPVSTSCRASCSRWVASCALRRTAAIGSRSTGTRAMENSLATTTSGARQTSSPLVDSWNRMSSSRCGRTRSSAHRATAVPTLPWLTVKKTTPARNAASRSACRIPVGSRKGWPDSRAYDARVAENVSVYCATLNSGRLQCLPRRRSSSTSGSDCASTTTPSGATSSRASAKVVEMVISSLLRPCREIWIGSSSPTTRTPIRTTSSTGSRSVPVRASTTHAHTATGRPRTVITAM